MSNTSPNNSLTKPKYYIGIDVGTQSTKAILYDPHTSIVLHRAYKSYDILPTTIPGRAEQDPEIWIDACKDCLTSLFSKADDCIVGGIGISGQQHGMVALDSNYNVLRPAKLWCDVECIQEAKEFSTKASAILNRYWNIPPGFTVPKVLWLKRNEPENFEKMAHCILPHDYVSSVLRRGDTTGSEMMVTDAGDASGTGIFDPVTRTYNSRLTSIIDERYIHMLPRVLNPTDVAGYLSQQWKQTLNVHYDIPISIGSGDNMCSALGVGCVQPGMAVLSLGTSGTIFGVSSTPVLPPPHNAVAPFCDATGRHLPLVCIMSCTGILQNVMDTFYPHHEGGHDHLTQLAKDVPPGCHGITFLPYLNGERTPNWPLSFGALMNITSKNSIHLASSENNQNGLVYRAALEGIAYTLKMALQEMQVACGEGGFTPSTLLAVGGGSKNTLWREILANVLELPLQFPLEAESAALGAAFQAAAAAEQKSVDEFVIKQKIELEEAVVVPTNDEAIKEVYRDGYQKFSSWSRKLFA